MQLGAEIGFEDITRPSSPELDAYLGQPLKALDHGFVRVIDYMGNMDAIVQAARVSYGRGTKTLSKDRGLVRYLMRHRHTTPFEMCEIKLHVKLPIFVARQWIRHRTANVNEYSARYSILQSEFYVPSPDQIQPQSTTNKQGRAGEYTAEEIQEITSAMLESYADSSANYDMLVGDEESGYGLARELSRAVMPLSTYTEWYWKIDLHNLLHFLALRMDSHAQYEIRAYADIIWDLVVAWMPAVAEAFEDYVLNACTFSAQEMMLIRKLITTDQLVRPEELSELSEREFQDFMQKIESASAV